MKRNIYFGGLLALVLCSAGCAHVRPERQLTYIQPDSYSPLRTPGLIRVSDKFAGWFGILASPLYYLAGGAAVESNMDVAVADAFK